MGFSNSKVCKIPHLPTVVGCFQHLHILTDSLKEAEKLIHDVHAELFNFQIIFA